MKILFVVDNYGNQTNGTAVTARRFAQNLIERGHSLSILSNAPADGEIEIFSLKDRYIPIVSEVAKKQKVSFAKPNKTTILNALKDVDVIHIITPWKVSRKVVKYAKKLNIPVTAAFHVQPENITYGAGFGRFGRPLAYYIYQNFRSLYNKIYRIHCPSQFIANELKKNAYKNQLRVISNGVNEAYFNQTITTNPEFFHIFSTGRYAKEKNQQLIIKAIALSQYKDKIKLTLAGSGPKEAKLRKLAEKLGVNTTFGFYSQQELIDRLKTADLYVHAADVEIEAISCLEAIAVGIVPVISNAKKSATSQFALDSRNLFEQGSALDLKNKIEYWYQNSEEKQKQQQNYQDFAKKFKITNSIVVFEEMLNEAIFEQKTEQLISNQSDNPYLNKIKSSKTMRFFSGLTYYLIALPVLSIYMMIFLRLRVSGHKNIRKVKGGAVVTSNHVHTMDSPMGGYSCYPKKPVFTSISENFDLPVAGFLVKILGTVPVPQSLSENRIFFNEMTKLARKGRFIHMFPEGELVKRGSTLREFRRGAFKIAVDAGVPIIPIGITFTNKEKRFSKKVKQYIKLNIGTPIYPDSSICAKEAITIMMNQTQEAMEQLIDNNPQGEIEDGKPIELYQNNN